LPDERQEAFGAHMDSRRATPTTPSRRR
jgi:hypothetical protein